MSITPKLICDMIQDAMVLDDDQIWIYNQRRAIPQDKRLYVVVGLISAKPYGNNSRFNSTTMSTEVTLYMQELISIDLFSYTMAAQERFHEALGAFQTTYGQQQCELNALRIAAIPMHVTDTSAIEGPTLLNRISISLQVLRKYDIVKASTYFDDYSDLDINYEQ
ncbi:MAG: hypothetical protein WCP55_00265 [Lentisphaerota bacterium]